jgi:hypothetical protein
MVTQVFGRQIATLFVALGILIGGIGPSWAVPAASGTDSHSVMTMTVADMPMPCAEMMKKSSPAKQMPCNESGSSCAVCVACAINITPQGFSPIALFYQGEISAVSRDANRNGVATAPPLPPPILHA